MKIVFLYVLLSLDLNTKEPLEFYEIHPIQMESMAGCKKRIEQISKEVEGSLSFCHEIALEEKKSL